MNLAFHDSCRCNSLSQLAVYALQRIHLHCGLACLASTLRRSWQKEGNWSILQWSFVHIICLSHFCCFFYLLCALLPCPAAVPCTSAKESLAFYIESNFSPDWCAAGAVGALLLTWVCQPCILRVVHMLPPGPKLQQEVKPSPELMNQGQVLLCSWGLHSRQAGQGACRGHRACHAHSHPHRCPSGVVWRYALALIGVIKQKLCRSLPCVEWEFLCSVCVRCGLWLLLWYVLTGFK